MAKKTFFLIVLFFAVTNTFAQSELSISFNNEDLSKSNVQMELTLNLESSIDSLLFISLPSKLKVIPISIKKNNQNLWLRNSVKIPKKDLLVSWVDSANELVFRFLPGTIVNGDKVIIVSMAKLYGKLAEEDKITVKTGESSADIAEVLLNAVNR